MGRQHRSSSGRKGSMKPVNVPELFTSAVNATVNARDLVRDAHLLLENQRHPRAFALAELAREELTKPMTYLGAALQLALGQEVDWARLDEHLHLHLVKIEMASLFDYLHTPHENLDQDVDDLVKEMLASGRTNDLKNYSLYASQVDGRPMKPPELINAELATEWVEQAQDNQRRVAAQMAVMVVIAGMSGESFQERIQQVLQEPEFQELLHWIERMVDQLGGKDAYLTPDTLRQMLADPETQHLLSTYHVDFTQMMEAVTQARDAHTPESSGSPA